MCTLTIWQLFCGLIITVIVINLGLLYRVWRFFNYESNKCVSKTHIDKRGVQLKLLAKIHIFLIRDFPWGLPSHVTHFWKALVEPMDPMLRPIWHLTLRLTVLEIFAVKIWDLGAPWWFPQMGEDLSGTDIYHHAKFHADRCHRRRDYVCSRADT